MRYNLLIAVFFVHGIIHAQNIGIGIETPVARLHIKGNEDTSQFIIDANSVQSNLKPLLRLRDAVGNDLLHLHSDHAYNVFLGYAAGRDNNPGISGAGQGNTFIGSNSGVYNTSGQLNTAVGRSALYQNLTGTQNTAIGMYALFSNLSASGNTALGFSAMRFTTAGAYNIAIGPFCMEFNTTGTANVAMGLEALQVSNGDRNVAIGGQALGSNTTGSDNVAIGKGALQFNKNNIELTAVGTGALFYNGVGGSIGLQGVQATAVGFHALYNNTVGHYNTAVGYNALQANSDGDWNTAIGRSALGNTDGGHKNVGLGKSALFTNISSGDNTAIGTEALYSATSNSNTGVGMNAGRNISTGGLNTALGVNSMLGNSTGVANVALGVGADLTGSHSNSSALGYFSTADASNKIRVGASFITSIGGQVGWTTFSDMRFKNDVKEDVPGIAFIQKLRPVSYAVDGQGLHDYYMALRKKTGAVTIEMNIPAEPRQSGFIAQEVERAATELSFQFSGVDKPTNATALYGLRYADFVVPMVKAMQEQQAVIERQGKEIEELKKVVGELLAAKK